MKTIKILAMALWLVAISTSVHGATYRDTDLFGGLGTQLNAGQSISGVFQIDQRDFDSINEVAGYDSDVEEILSATAAFFLGLGDDLVASTVDIFLGSSVFRDDAGVPVYNFVVGNSSVQGSALFNLQEDGRLDYTITAETGTLIVYEATLRATSGPRSIGVPDGGSSVFLLGFGLMGLGFLKRKLSA